MGRAACADPAGCALWAQVLTKDPVAHTLVNGKRLLCNDMWGAGIISLGLVLGFAEMDSVRRPAAPHAALRRPAARRGPAQRAAAGTALSAGAGAGAGQVKASLRKLSPAAYNETPSASKRLDAVQTSPRPVPLVRLGGT